MQASGGLDLPHWQGCHVLKEGEVFLLNEHPQSLDGRYFGAIMEDALRAYLDPRRTAARDDILVQHLDRIEKRQNAMERDLALCLETLGQFVLYWLTRTEPIPEAERDAAQLLGQRRFEFFIDQVAKRVASDEPLSRQALPPMAVDPHNV